MERVYVESITNEEVSQLPIGAFSGKIVVIDRPEDVATACEQLRQKYRAAGCTAKCIMAH